MVFIISLFFFFFQAEDGIRDLTVTGVQTCALPISLAQRAAGAGEAAPGGREVSLRVKEHSAALAALDEPWLGVVAHGSPRSEERRVGKECRSRWSPYH